MGRLVSVDLSALTILVAAVSSSEGDHLASPERRVADAMPPPPRPLSTASTLKTKVHEKSPAAKIKPAGQLLHTSFTPANLYEAGT